MNKNRIRYRQLDFTMDEYKEELINRIQEFNNI